MISRWRNNDFIFWGKYSTGATPKINKTRDPLQASTETLPTASTMKNKKHLKRQKTRPDERNVDTKLFDDLVVQTTHKEGRQSSPFGDYKLDDKELMSPELLSPRSPNPDGRSYKDYINNSLSIKKERKMFDRYVDLNDDEATTDYMEEEFHGKHKSVFYTGKKEDAKRRNSSPIVSRFSSDYEILEVEKIYLAVIFGKKRNFLFYQVIGNGCFGSVYKCRNKFDGNIYAIKSTKNKILGKKIILFFTNISLVYICIL